MDFYVTLPYGFATLFACVSGYYIEHEGTSFLLSGAIMSAGLFTLGVVSWDDYNTTGLNLKGFSWVGLVFSFVIALYMGHQYQVTGHFYAPGLVSCMSMGASGFYVAKIMEPDQKKMR